MDAQITTIWIERLQAGESLAAQRIWEHFYERLIRLARRKLANGKRGAADEEDVVVVAFNSFFRGVQQQRFPQLNDRDDLWQILVMLTARKAIDLLKFEHRLKRGGGQVLGESIYLQGDSSKAGLDAIDKAQPTPEFAAQMTEQMEQLLESLQDASLRKIALAKLEGYSNEELAQQLDCGVRTVERKLSLIRAVWKEHIKP